MKVLSWWLWALGLTTEARTCRALRSILTNLRSNFLQRRTETPNTARTVITKQKTPLHTMPSALKGGVKILLTNKEPHLVLQMAYRHFGLVRSFWVIRRSLRIILKDHKELSLHDWPLCFHETSHLDGTTYLSQWLRGMIVPVNDYDTAQYHCQTRQVTWCRWDRTAVRFKSQLVLQK